MSVTGAGERQRKVFVHLMGGKWVCKVIEGEWLESTPGG